MDMVLAALWIMLGFLSLGVACKSPGGWASVAATLMAVGLFRAAWLELD